MKCIKNMIDDDKYEIVISDENDNKFTIYCDDLNLYLVMDQYYSENEFLITKDNRELFLRIHYLFSEIFRIDNKFHNFINENIFEWINDKKDLKNSNKLIIEKENSFYKIKFIKGLKNIYSLMDNSCSIVFPLNENQEIVSVIHSIYLSYQFEDLRANQKRFIL